MTETILSLAVTSIAFASADGSSIFSGSCPEGNRVRVVARKNSLPRAPLIGEVWEIAGENRTHPKFGEQLHARRGKYLVPRGRLIVSYLASNPDFEGIGEAKANALYEAFGERLVTILGAGDISALATVLSASLAQRLIAVGAEKLEEAALVDCLDDHGVDLGLANTR